MMLKETVEDNNNLYKVSKQCVEYRNILLDRKERRIGNDETRRRQSCSIIAYTRRQKKTNGKTGRQKTD